MSKNKLTFKLHIFRRIIFWTEDENSTLVIYIGDSDVAKRKTKDSKHGNAKSSRQPYLKVSPIVQNELVDIMKSGKTPLEVSLYQFLFKKKSLSRLIENSL